MPATEFRPFDVVECLKTKEDMVCYLEAALEDGTPDMIAAALSHIARACGLGADVPFVTLKTPGPGGDGGCLMAMREDGGLVR